MMYRRRQSGLGATNKAASWHWVRGAGSLTAGSAVGLQTAGATKSAISGVIAGGIAAAAPFAGPAAPFLAAAALLVAPLTRIIQGCGQSCIEAARIADEAERQLKQLRDEYLSQAVRTRSMQAAVLEYMDQVFAWLQQSCQTIGGAAGQRCISERLVKGGSAPWCPTRTGCDWLTTLRDPVALDQSVVADSDGPTLNDLFSGGGGVAATGVSAWAPVALGVAALFILLRGD